MLCVTPVAIVGSGTDKDEILVCGMEEKHTVVACNCGMEKDETVDVMTFITSITVVLGLRRTCTASLADRLAESANPLVISVSLTSESKLSPGQRVTMCWEKSNSTE